MRRSFFGIVLLIAASLFASCSSDDEKNARVEVWLTDAPGDYEQVNIDVEGVEIHSSATDDGQGWKSVDVEGGVYNLLDLTNGVDTLLGSIEIPSGRISQIRLQLGDNNSLVVDSETHELTIASGAQSGLKLNVQQDFVGGVTYKILLDFDVARSIVNTGSGDYKLKPVIRVITEATSGAIAGAVDPKEATPAIYAISGTDTVGTTYADSTGHFLLRGIGAGSYNVSISPNQNYVGKTITDVTVNTGDVTDLGTVTLDEQ